MLATRNPGKVREVQEAIADLDVQVITLDPTLPEVEETEPTFVGNALLKARAACAAMGHLALADDSGLVVDALNGEPGVYSARWAPTTDERNDKLLARLQGVPDPQRTARFVSAIAMVAPDGREAVVEGYLEGHIGHGRRGTGGFGYDPLFVLPDGRTLAELSIAEKNAISHRGKALMQARAKLAELLGR